MSIAYLNTQRSCVLFIKREIKYLTYIPPIELSFPVYVWLKLTIGSSWFVSVCLRFQMVYLVGTVTVIYYVQMLIQVVICIPTSVPTAQMLTHLLVGFFMLWLFDQHCCTYIHYVYRYITLILEQTLKHKHYFKT